MKNKYDVIIIGGGIVGVSTAYNLLCDKPNLKVAILEKEPQVSLHQTGNNSGVIHSGIYYKPGSEKAKNCISGYSKLISFCYENEIDFEICGKVIVQVNQKESQAFENIYNRGLQNGLKDLRKLSKEEVREIEPHVSCIQGIHVPQTGIINYKKVVQKLVEISTQKGCNLVLNAKVINIICNENEITIISTIGEFKTKNLINCAGLYSDKIAQLVSKNSDVKIIPFRGEYFELKDEKKSLVKNLIYPVPNPEFPFLGVHFTRMIDGRVEAGPNAVLAFSREGYKKWDINIKELFETITYPGFRKIAMKYRKEGWEEIKRSYSKKLFVKAMQQIIPEISENDVVSGGAGVRAQACSYDGHLLDDFKIIKTGNIINVINAPSPAATSSLAIGEYISNQIN